jgi:hypothetical protein
MIVLAAWVLAGCHGMRNRPVQSETFEPPPLDPGQVALMASAPMVGRFEVIGQPRLDLAVQADREQAVRACIHNSAGDLVKCDFRTLPPIETWLPAGASVPEAAALTPDLYWYGTGAGCTSSTGRPAGIEARTGACEPPSDAPCRVSVRTGVVLSAYEYCALRLHAARCAPQEDCLVSCLNEGRNNQFAGGCWHLCFAHR